jgi:hypothetical protein
MRKAPQAKQPANGTATDVKDENSADTLQNGPCYREQLER